MLTRILAAIILGLIVAGCAIPAAYTSYPAGVRSVTTYRPDLSGIPDGIVPIRGGAFYVDGGVSNSGLDAGIVGDDGRLRQYLIRAANQLESVAPDGDGTFLAASISVSPVDAPWRGEIERLRGEQSAVVLRIPPSLGYAEQLVQSPSGKWWVSLPDAHAIGELTPRMKLAVPIKFKALNPAKMAFDSKGVLYVTFGTSFGSNRNIARVTRDRRIEMLRARSPVGSIAARAGGAWFTESASNVIGYVTSTGKLEQLPVGGGVRVLDAIAVGRNSVWFAAQGGVGRLTLKTHALTFIPLPDRDSTPNALAVSRTGDVWLTASIDDPRCFAECGGITRIVP